MDSEKHETTGSKDSEAHQGPAEPVIESAALGTETAMGVIASSAAKVSAKSESVAPEPKPKEKPRKSTAKQRAATDEAPNKHSAGRMAKKKKKRAAHRLKLKRSNTKG